MNSNAEFHEHTLDPGLSPFRFITDINETDELGRPLGESRSSEEVRKGVLFDFRVASYPDSRNGFPINDSALKEVGSSYDDMIGIFSEMRNILYPDTEILSISELTMVATAGETLPVYLSLRRDNPIAPGHYPAEVAAVYKASAGIGSLTYSLMLFHPHVRDYRVPGNTYYRSADKHGVLISDGQGCAAPPAMIIDVLEKIVEKERTKQPTSNRYTHILGNPDAFRQFVYAESAIYNSMRAYTVAASDAYYILHEDIDEGLPELQKDLLLQKRMQSLLTHESEDSDLQAYFSEYIAALYGFTQTLNSNVPAVNKALGRKDPSPNVTVDEVEHEYATQISITIQHALGRKLTPEEQQQLL